MTLLALWALSMFLGYSIISLGVFRVLLCHVLPGSSQVLPAVSSLSFETPERLPYKARVEVIAVCVRFNYIGSARI